MARAFPPFGTKLSAAAAPADSNTIEASTWRWDGTNGTVLVSSGFPLKPGYVTAATVSQVRVYVNSVEQAVAIHPLDGTFPDGSYRSIGIQFSYNLTSDTPVSSQVKVNAGARGTLDLTWTEPTHTIARKRAVIAPTEPAYLCDTFVTLIPLTPATNDSGNGITWSDWAATKWSNADTQNGTLPGTALYDHVQGLFAYYCRTGTRSWYQWAYDWATTFPGDSSAIVSGDGLGDAPSKGNFHMLLPYMNPTDGALGASSACTNNNTWNPEGLTGLLCGIPNEAFSMRAFSLPCAYWMTAWRQFKRNAAEFANFGLYLVDSGYTTKRDYWMDAFWGARFNLGVKGMVYPLIGYLMGCTTTFTVPGGFGGPTSWDYETYLPWTIDALEDYTWNLGDYRDGVVGLRDDVVSNPGGESGISTFQLMLTAEYLMLYYDHVKPDSRIPGMLSAIGTYVVNQTRAANSFDTAVYTGHQWVMPYQNLPLSMVADTTFVATLTNGSPNITWTAGPLNIDLEQLGVGSVLGGTGIPTGAVVIGLSGSVLTMNVNATASGSQTVHTPINSWYFAVFHSLFSWLYAYTGTSSWLTWADRAANTTGVDLGAYQTKNWGEYFGGTRSNYFYYRNGNAVRGATGIHPTVITNPPTQATLG